MSENTEEKRPKRLTFLKYATVAVIAAAVGAFWGPSQVPVAPTLTNQSEENEEFICPHLGFENCSLVFETNETKARGTNTSQSLGPGMVLSYRGSTIELTYSSGPAKSTMPELIGLTAEEAANTLYPLGFNVGEITFVHDVETPTNTILEISHEAGKTYNNGTVVHLKIASDAVVLPDWENKTLADVRTEAKNLGLELKVTGSQKDTAIVISQFPREETIPKGSQISVQTYDSEKSETAELPKLIGMTKDEAQNLLLESGFLNITFVEVENNAVNSSQITQTIPTSGEKLEVSEHIVVIISNPVS